MGVSKMVRFQWKIPWNWMIRGYPHLCKLSHTCNYRYMAVDLNSFLCERSFANETMTFANLREPLVYLLRGCNYPLLCCWDAHANSNCVSDPGVSWKPHSLDLPLQRCCGDYWFPWTPSRHCFCGTVARLNRKSFANQPKRTQPESWLGACFHLITLKCLGLFSACQ